MGLPPDIDAAYDREIQKIRETEFSHAAGTTYLDHAGATLYAKSQLEAHLKDLSSRLYGNPHSQNPSSRLTTDVVDYVREVVLRHFNTDTDQYDIVFTSGCTGALQLLSQSFPWSGNPEPKGSETEVLYAHRHEGASVDIDQLADSPNESHCINGDVPEISEKSLVENESPHHKDHYFPNDNRSVFCYLEDNHTSVVGIREVAAQCGARIVCATEHEVIFLQSDTATCKNQATQCHTKTTGRTKDGDLEQILASTHHSLRYSDSSTLSIHNEETESDSDMMNHLQSADSLSNDISPQDELYHLFAYPAQSNFSGRKYPLSWLQDIPSGRASIAGLGNLGGSWKILLDAAAFVSTNPLDLLQSPAHFVSLSFYKVFGFPTGLGALLVRSDCCSLLHKSYYGGGTVLATISRKGFHIPRQQLHDRFEDGTLPFLDIIALRHGFEALQRLGRSLQCISQHTFSLARHVHHRLSELRHGNGRPVCVLYCDSDFEDSSTQGGILNLNLLRPDGHFVGYSEVDRLACVQDIHLRTGCFCNTGACMSFLGLTAERVVQNVEAGHVCGDNIDLVDGYPTGSVRISFGYMSTFEDANKFVAFIEQCFVDRTPQPDVRLRASEDSSSHSKVANENPAVTHPPHSNEPTAVVQYDRQQQEERVPNECLRSGREGQEQETAASLSRGRSELPEEGRPIGSEASGRNCSHPIGEGSPCLRAGDAIEVWDERGKGEVTLERIALFPVKSCGAFQVSSWPIGKKGLLFDREWMVLSEHSSCLSQKQEPRLCLIRPAIDLATRKLTLSAEGWPSLTIPLDVEPTELSQSHSQMHSAVLQTRVCGDRVQGLDCGEEAAQWVSRVIGRKCQLVRQNPSSLRNARKQPAGSSGISLSLANEAQFLLVSMATVEQLLSAIQARQQGGELTVEELVGRFRPNLVVGGAKPYVEEQWTELHSAGLTLKVTGQCTRCQMICVDQLTAKRSAEPLQTLMALLGNKATFGIYLAAMLE